MSTTTASPRCTAATAPAACARCWRRRGAWRRHRDAGRRHVRQPHGRRRRRSTAPAGLLADAGMPIVILPGNHDPVTRIRSMSAAGSTASPICASSASPHDRAVAVPGARPRNLGQRASRLSRHGAAARPAAARRALARRDRARPLRAARDLAQPAAPVLADQRRDDRRDRRRLPRARPLGPRRPGRRRHHPGLLLGRAATGRRRSTWSG